MQPKLEFDGGRIDGDGRRFPGVHVRGWSLGHDASHVARHLRAQRGRHGLVLGIIRVHGHGQLDCMFGQFADRHDW
ncbi:MAG TPA: hypothetical protein VG142_10060 [Trebonia sp.]|jgi:hypothetical protein|nr:hypothetical protein [Trebonia sp.]